MTKTEFIDLISFCILMENDEGIVEKRPNYVLEKWKSKCPGLLDQDNLRKFERYQHRWEGDISRLED